MRNGRGGDLCRDGLGTDLLWSVLTGLGALAVAARQVTHDGAV